MSGPNKSSQQGLVAVDDTRGLKAWRRSVEWIGVCVPDRWDRVVADVPVPHLDLLDRRDALSPTLCANMGPKVTQPAHLMPGVEVLNWLLIMMWPFWSPSCQLSTDGDKVALDSSLRGLH